MPLKKILFLCIGNSCRSQMAEGFARAYGSDVMVARSAGLSPAGRIAPLTYQTMKERNILLDGQFPKGLDAFPPTERFDLVINLSGHSIPVDLNAPVEEWKVRDPIGEEPEVYQQVATQLENLVMTLILRLRREAAARPAPVEKREPIPRGLGRSLGRSKP
ncbi:MAG TPA: hypothetical protein VKV15_04480 [Bryobacteraceae bacterium]|nr:hypothetical protein [Bryobacteraceae bacterium]